MSLEKQKTKLPCPKCKKDIEITYYEMINRREAKCRRCGSKLNVDFSSSSRFKAKLRNLEKAQEDFDKAFNEMISTADITLKN